jgi:hypothetical protein
MLRGSSAGVDARAGGAGETLIDRIPSGKGEYKENEPGGGEGGAPFSRLSGITCCFSFSYTQKISALWGALGRLSDSRLEGTFEQLLTYLYYAPAKGSYAQPATLFPNLEMLRIAGAVGGFGCSSRFAAIVNRSIPSSRGWEFLTR